MVESAVTRKFLPKDQRLLVGRSQRFNFAEECIKSRPPDLPAFLGALVLLVRKGEKTEAGARSLVGHMERQLEARLQSARKRTKALSDTARIAQELSAILDHSGGKTKIANKLQDLQKRYVVKVKERAGPTVRATKDLKRLRFP